MLLELFLGRFLCGPAEIGYSQWARRAAGCSWRSSLRSLQAEYNEPVKQWQKKHFSFQVKNKYQQSDTDTDLQFWKSLFLAELNLGLQLWRKSSFDLLPNHWSWHQWELCPGECYKIGFGTSSGASSSILYRSTPNMTYRSETPAAQG